MMRREMLARRQDPHTSHEAAASIVHSVARQESLIWSVLCDRGPMTAEGIADEICRQYAWQADAVAVCRRFRNMERRGLIRYAGYTLPQLSGKRARAMAAIQPDAKYT